MMLTTDDSEPAAELSPARVRFSGDWQLLPPRRAAPRTELRALQDAMPRCPDGGPPVLSGDGTERAMLIGQAPGWREVELGLPFAGDAGKRLVGWLSLAGIGLDDFRQRWYVSSVGKCYPGRVRGSSSDRPPSPAEVARWSPYLREEVRLLVPALILLVGRLAHRFAFGDRPVHELVGRELRWADATTICLPHPSGASTWLNTPENVVLWRRSLELLARRWSELRT